MILAPHRSGEAPAVNVAGFVFGFAVVSNPVEWLRIHSDVGEDSINPCGSVPPGEDYGVAVQCPVWLAWSAVVITTDVSGNPSGEKAFKAFFGACRHRS